MVKIKQKKQLNLPQLIEWGFENDVTGAMFPDNRVKAKMVRFEVGVVISIYGYMNKQDTFTVEVEEEITEDIALSKLVERWKHDDEGDGTFRYVEHDDKSINRVLFSNPESVEVTHFYAEIDGELELIWRDGKLVE